MLDMRLISMRLCNLLRHRSFNSSLGPGFPVCIFPDYNSVTMKLKIAFLFSHKCISQQFKGSFRTLIMIALCLKFFNPVKYFRCLIIIGSKVNTHFICFFNNITSTGKFRDSNYPGIPY